MTMRLARQVNRPRHKPFTAVDVMTPNPKSIDHTATVRETAEVLQKSGIHIAPVIDAAGRPIGVVSRTDLLDYWGRRRDRLAAWRPENWTLTLNSQTSGFRVTSLRCEKS